MIQEGDEISDRPLKVNVVLPERIIGVDEQVLTRQYLFCENGRHVFYLIELCSSLESREHTSLLHDKSRPQSRLLVVHDHYGWLNSHRRIAHELN